jgi:hypothetical protein
MKNISLWSLILFVIILPVFVVEIDQFFIDINIIKTHFDIVKNHISFLGMYNLVGFLPCLILFFILNLIFNTNTAERRVLNWIAFCAGMTWFIYMVIALLNGESV